jgi:hypothetical protein
MATTSKPANPAVKPSKSTLDYLELALDDLAKARVQAHKQAHGSIDHAVQHIGHAVRQLRRAQKTTEPLTGIPRGEPTPAGRASAPARRA